MNSKYFREVIKVYFLRSSVNVRYFGRVKCHILNMGFARGSPRSIFLAFS
jgi:hypothetical protein